jgi:hypothetical protein
MAKANATTLEKPATAALNFDAFMGEEFEGDSTSFPHCQILNSKNIDESGLFIAQDKVDASGFVPSPSWLPHTHTFESGDTTTGYRCICPRMAVVRQGPLMMSFREGNAETREFVMADYDKATMTASQKFMVFLLDDDNQPLHSQPLQFNPKGAFSKGFSDAVKTMKSSANSAFSQLTKISKSRGERFFGLCVLSLELDIALKGMAPKAKWCSNIKSVGKITAANFAEYWLGNDEAVKSAIAAAYDDNPDFGVMRNAAPTTPVADDGDSFEYEYTEESPMGLAGDPKFAKVKAVITESLTVEQLTKRVEWALGGKQGEAFADWPEYADLVGALATDTKTRLETSFDDIPF